LEQIAPDLSYQTNVLESSEQVFWGVRIGEMCSRRPDPGPAMLPGITLRERNRWGLFHPGRPGRPGRFAGAV